MIWRAVMGGADEQSKLIGSFQLREGWYKRIKW